MAKFGAGDPYQQQYLERREIIEASHKAAIQMAEILGQDANVHAIGALSGQHAAIPLPNSQQGLSQPIKLFLPNKETPGIVQELDFCDIRYKGIQQNDHGGIENTHANYETKLVDISSSSKEEKEELITEVLERRLAYLYMAFQPPEPVEGPADTLFIVRRSKTIGDKILIRAHSQVLKRTNDTFNELIGYRPPMVPTPSNLQEAKDTRMQISWTHEDVYAPHHSSIYSKLMTNIEEERKDKYFQATSDYEEKRGEQLKSTKMVEDKSKGNVINASKSFNKSQREGDIIYNKENFMTSNNFNEELLLGGEIKGDQDTNSINRIEDVEIVRLEAQSLEKMDVNQRRVNSSQDLQTKRMDLGLENVTDNLQDSMKPSLVNQFLDVNPYFVQLPGGDLSPPDLKQSFEQFATSVNKFKYPDLKPLRAEANRAQTEVDGKSLESELLGMVGRGNKEMLNIINNIGQGVAERRASKILIEKARLEDLEGKPGNAISAKVPRTSLERRKSQTYIENQERRASISPSARLKSVAAVTHQNKRISPSFLERRQSKALGELARKEQAATDVEEMNLRRRSSKAVMAAFERQKRFSTLENQRTKELQFGFPFRKSIIKSGERRDSKSRRTSNTTRIQRQFGIARKSVPFKSKIIGSPKQPEAKMASRSQQITLNHTRGEDKDEVVQFYEDEGEDIYETSSSSSLDLAPPYLPKGVEFVIEKMHWTFDTLCALMEFIYTETLHASCEELPDIYKAANEILLSSLIDAIRLKPIIQYYRLAMLNDENRTSLLDLANLLTTTEDIENHINKNEDFFDLKKLCEAFELAGIPKRRPYTLLLETGHIAFRNNPFVTQGLHTIEGQMVLVLSDPREGTKLFEKILEENDFLTFQKKISDQRSAKPFPKMHWLGKWPPIEKTRNREKAWKVYFFDFIELQRDIPLKNYIFYKHLNSLTLRPIGKEEFNLRIVCGLLIWPILYKALQLAFPQLDIVVGRGAGYYLGGETHGNNITLTGHPLYLLRACKSLPQHLIGRTVLRVAHPCEKTFVRLWMSTNRFGVDFECGIMYFLKPLIQIQKILEYWHNIDIHANYIVTHPREMVELVEPHDPF